MNYLNLNLPKHLKFYKTLEEKQTFNSRGGLNKPYDARIIDNLNELDDYTDWYIKPDDDYKVKITSKTKLRTGEYPNDRENFKNINYDYDVYEITYDLINIIDDDLSEHDKIEYIAVQKNKYFIVCRENGDILQGYETLDEAEKVLSEYEKEDKLNDDYTQDFYEIVKGV